jgi:hypothetical protein
MTIQPGSGYTFTASSLGTNLAIEKPWAPLFWGAENDCPFTVSLKGTEESDYLFSCKPGTVNSIIPQLGTAASADMRLDTIPSPTTNLNFSSEGYSYIHLKVSIGTGFVFPVNNQSDILYPRIISNSEQQFATADSVFLLLATVYKDPETDAITVNQLTCGSFWCDRIQVGLTTSMPYYFFAKA